MLAVAAVTSSCGDGSAPGADTGGAEVLTATTTAATTESAGPVPAATTAAGTTSSVAGEPTAVAARPSECTDRIPLATAAGQLVLALAAQSGIGDLTGALIDGRLGGLVLVGDLDVGIGAALAPLARVWPPPIVAVDEEGGSVQRLGSVLGELPSARFVGDSGDPTVAFELGRARAAGAVGLGITMILAPNLDVGNSSGVVERTYGDDADTVTRFGLAYAAGLTVGGVVPVVKHFPGHGSTEVDSHLVLPVTPPLDRLRRADLVPFVAAARRVPAVMMGHLAVPGLTGSEPATLSGPAVDLLRRDLGFGGLLMTDDLAMDALDPLTVAEAAELALAAGHDLLIAGPSQDAVTAVDRLADAVTDGRLDRSRIDQALTRVLAVKGLDPCAMVAG